MATPQPRSIDRVGPWPPAYTSFPTLLWPHRSPFCFSHMPSSFLPKSLCTCCPPTPRRSHGKALLVTLVLPEMASLRMTTQPRIPSGPPIVLLHDPFDGLHSIRALKSACSFTYFLVGRLHGKNRPLRQGHVHIRQCLACGRYVTKNLFSK